MGAKNTVQQTFRFREDDGSETGASWLGAGNGSDISRGTGTGNKFRLRNVVEETAGGNSNVPRPLYASYNSGTYFLVGASSSYVRSVASDYVTDNVVTSAQLGWSGTFVAGRFDSNGTVTTNVTLVSEYTEMEYCLYIVDADVADGDTLDFRTYDASAAPCDAYTDTGRLTVTKAEDVEVTPAAGHAIGGVVNPTVQQGSTSASPAAGHAIGGAVNPTIQLGSTSSSPAYGYAIGYGVEPGIELGDLSLAPAYGYAIGYGLDPTVDLSGVVIPVVMHHLRQQGIS